MMENLICRGKSNDRLIFSWGANSWDHKTRNTISPYHLSYDGTFGGLKATYFADMNFSNHLVERIETPALDWDLYPPLGVPSKNFSAIWEGELHSPVDTNWVVEGWIGVDVGANSTARLYINNTLILSSDQWVNSLLDDSGYANFPENNHTETPRGATSFTFKRDETYHIVVKYQSWTLGKARLTLRIQTHESSSGGT